MTMNISKVRIINRTPLDDFPEDLFTSQQRMDGAIVFHILGAIYFFVLLAVICNDYFLPSVECVCEDLNIPKVGQTKFLHLQILNNQMKCLCVGCSCSNIHGEQIFFSEFREKENVF